MILVALTLCGHSKDYVLSRFWEMADACLRRDDVDLVVLGDRPDATPEWATFQPVEWRLGSTYAEDMLWATRDYASELARAGDYDAMMWHGVDALWDTRDGFDALLAGLNHYDVVAPLIAARTDSSVAVARRFLPRETGEGSPWLLEQEYIPTSELLSGAYVEAGFPGADNILISRRCYDVNFHGHRAWYERVAKGETNVCVEEYWCWKAKNRGFSIAVDTSTHVWHVGEDMIARQYPSVEVSVEALEWP